MRRKILLSLIIIVGAYLRLSNLGWGLPEVFEEATPWRQAWGMWGFETGRFDFNPHFFNYPAFTFYMQWIGQALIYVVGKASGTFALRRDMLAAFETDPYRFYLVGRLITSLFGIASVYLLYKLGKELFSPTVGLLAAFFLAFNFFHIRRGQLITTDIPLVFFILLAFIPIWKIATEGSRRHYIWAGVCVGLATAVKYPGLMSAAGIVAAHLYRHIARRQSWKTIVLSPRIWISAGVVVLVFFMVSPYCFVDYSGFYRDFRFEQAHMKIGHFGSPERLMAYGRYLRSIIPGIMTVPLIVLTLGGLGYGIWKCRNRSVILLTFPLVYFLVVGSWRTAAEHYIFPVIPFLLLFAALLLRRIFETLPLSGSRLLLGVAACLLVLPSAVRTQRFYARLDVLDNRTVARQWVEENIEKGSAIVKEEYTPDFSTEDYVIFELPLSALYPESTEPFYDLQWYVDFDFIIISSEVYQRYKNEPGNYQVHNLFYRDLDEYATLIKEFGDLSGSGPQIKIYEVGKGVGRTPEQDFPPGLLPPLIDSPDRQANAKLLCNLANVLSQKHKPTKAVRLYQLAIAVDSTLSKAWYNMGLTFGNQGMLRESEEALRQAVRLDSTYASSWIALGHLYGQTGDLDSSIDAYEHGLRHDPYRLDVIRILSEQYIRKGRADDAAAIAERGLELSRGSPEFHFILGSSYLARKDYGNAIRSLRKAVELRPSDGKYVYYLAGAYYSNKDYGAALEFARKAEELGYDAGELIEMLRKVSPSGPQ